MDAAKTPETIDTHEEATEVVVMWGDAVLHVTHLSPDGEFVVGDALDARGRPRTDYVIGRETLGRERLPVVVATSAGVAVVVPEGAMGVVRTGATRSFAPLSTAASLAPWAGADRARAYLLAPGATAWIEHQGFVFLVTRTHRARSTPRAPFQLRWGEHGWLFGATLAHVAMLALFQLLPPHAAALSAERLSDQTRLIPIEVLAPSTFDVPPPPTPGAAASDGEAGERHTDDEGAMGEKDAPRTKKRHAVAGPIDNPDPHLAKTASDDPAEREGILGVLKTFAAAANGPTSPYARNEALGRDPMAALGELMGPTIGESFGFGALGPRGTGRGSGGDGLGTIGLKRIGTLGHDGDGRYGSRATPFRDRGIKVPPVRPGRADVQGALSKEVIQRVIRRHLSEIRYCYEQGLQTRPDLEGRVAVKFVVGASGAVQTAVVASSSLGDARVEGCVARSVGRWAFPQPDGGGVVIVSYPFTFQQSGR